MNRRTFLSASAGAALAGKAASANDRVEVAVIGVRGQGRGLARGFSAFDDVNVRYLCDVDERVYDRTAGEVAEVCGSRPKYVKDLRTVLDDAAVDAVAIATPDHWHAPATILACDAGKDVYVEKPASHNLREGRLMVEAARRNDRVVQLGTQSRSRPSTLKAIELVHSGKIGPVLMAKAWDVQLRDDIGHQEDSPPPPEVDFDTWTGPAPMLPFNENRFHYKWHWNWNYGTGDMGNDGVHQLDIARWALGVDSPLRVSGMGRKVFFKDDQQTPDTMNLTFDFGEKLIQFELRIWNPYGMNEQANGVAVYGTEGMIHIGRWPKQWGYRLYDRKGKLMEDTSKASSDPGTAHLRNFIDCVKSRKKPNAEIAVGHRSSSLCHLGNIVARSGRNIRFDGESEQIVGGGPVSAMLKRTYRDHWSVPKGV
jgi:predicted dehydrogenase